MTDIEPAPTHATFETPIVYDPDDLESGEDPVIQADLKEDEKKLFDTFRLFTEQMMKQGATEPTPIVVAPDPVIRQFNPQPVPTEGNPNEAGIPLHSTVLRQIPTMVEPSRGSLSMPISGILHFAD